MESTEVGFEEFRSSWLESVQEGSPSTRELGRRFALKTCDLSGRMPHLTKPPILFFVTARGDGGIDIALLDTGADAANETVWRAGTHGISYRANTALPSRALARCWPKAKK